MIRNIHFIGMGALGLLFAQPIQKKLNGRTLAFVMDEERKERHQTDVYTINGESVHYEIVTPEEVKASGPADLVILGVKYPALSSALKTMENSVGEHTTIISMMNGIDSEEILASKFGREKVLYCVAQEMDAQRYGTDLRYTKHGQLFVGVPNTPEFADVSAELTRKCDEVCAFFDEVGMWYTREEDILYRLWSKFMLNVGSNQISMVFHCGYGRQTEHGTEEFAMMTGAMREVCLIAQAKGIPVTDREMNHYLSLIAKLDPEAFPSMGQDRVQKNPSEVDMFAGVVNRLGDELGIETPVNEFLYRRAKEIEAEY